MDSDRFIVVTTIHPKSDGLRALERQDGWHVIVAGDRMTPPLESGAQFTCLPIEQQAEAAPRLSPLLPENHYARKNTGYLAAMARGARVIFDTDDDNLPLPGWHLPDFTCSMRVAGRSRFVNMYAYFTTACIWPRGFPLDEIGRRRREQVRAEPSEKVRIGLWQGMVHGDPDVDAIYRLIIGRKVRFRKKKPCFLPPGRYSPVNSQNTFWGREAFPYLYLPSTVGSRFADILRGYVAQRLLWQHGLHTGFLPACLRQLRNPHDLMTDFREETEVFLQVRETVQVLENIPCTAACPSESLPLVYREFHRLGIVSNGELLRLEAWLADWQAASAAGKQEHERRQA